MKNSIFRLTFFSLVLGSLFIVSSCSDDDSAGAVPFDFEGDFAITSATDDVTSTDVLPVLGAALLADTPCDLTITGNASLIRLENGNDAISGTLFNICAAEPALTEEGGTWAFNEAQNSFSLTLIVDASPFPIPLVQQNVTLTPADGGTVTTISGTINLAAVVPDLPNNVTLTLTRVQ